MNHFYRMTEKIIKYKNKTPIIKKNVFIADGSKVIGTLKSMKTLVYGLIACSEEMLII